MEARLERSIKCREVPGLFCMTGIVSEKRPETTVFAAIVSGVRERRLNVQPFVYLLQETEFTE